MTIDTAQPSGEVNGAEFETLKEKMRRVMKNHIERQNGIISAPDKLLDKLLLATADWLQHDEENWGNTEGVVSEALRDLRTNQLR